MEKGVVQYRKSGLRIFYRIDGEQVVRVINKRSFSALEVGNDYTIHDSATDVDNTKECSEEEFTSAYREALERITKMNIV
jgi:hypothetical protein